MLTQNEEDMQQGSTYPMQDDNDIQPYPLDIVPTLQVITHIASHFEMTNKIPLMMLWRLTINIIQQHPRNIRLKWKVSL